MLKFAISYQISYLMPKKDFIKGFIWYVKHSILFLTIYSFLLIYILLHEDYEPIFLVSHFRKSNVFE